MYRVCKTFWIETGHFLTSQQIQSDCRMPHGHSRKLEVVIAAEELDQSNMVFDFQAFKAAIGDYLDSMDHAMYINTNSPHYEYFKTHFKKVIPFEGKDPTSEVIAKSMFEYIEKKLQPGSILKTNKGFEYHIRNKVKLERVRLWETKSSWAEFTREN